MKKRAIIISLILLMILSIANNFYASFYMSSYSNYYIKQLVWYLIGFFIIFLLNKINIDFIIKKSFYLYLLGNLLLLLVLIIGKTVNGARSWLLIAGFSFQPSEFMKIFIILYLYYLTISKNFSDLKYILITFLIILIPSVLTFLEPDTGAVLFYFIIYFVFILLKRVNKYYYISFFSLISLSIITLVLIYFFNQDLFINIFGTSFLYRMDRITNFINLEGYQIETALTSISNSNLFGVKDVIYFPEAPTDFAFTLFLANFGIVGIVLLVVVYFIFFKSLLYFKDNRFLLYPVFYLILFQYTVNILMNIGFFPIIGITLPFISYGGSSLISYMIIIGIIINKKSIKNN